MLTVPSNSRTCTERRSVLTSCDLGGKKMDCHRSGERRVGALQRDGLCSCSVQTICNDLQVSTFTRAHSHCHTTVPRSPPTAVRLRATELGSPSARGIWAGRTERSRKNCLRKASSARQIRAQFRAVAAMRSLDVSTPPVPVLRGEHKHLSRPRVESYGTGL